MKVAELRTALTENGVDFTALKLTLKKDLAAHLSAVFAEASEIADLANGFIDDDSDHCNDHKGGVCAIQNEDCEPTDYEGYECGDSQCPCGAPGRSDAQVTWLFFF